MALKPWYSVVTPREDLREGKPLDAAEFAVHLDHVRDGRAPPDYQDAERFFERTFLTKNLTKLSGEVIRRLSGEKTEASAVFSMATQFGGGKTHALTLLYHLATLGPGADRLPGVNTLLTQAQVKSVPKAAVAVFVGTDFDSITGRGGSDGTPLRKTPWGELAFQLGGLESFEQVREQEETFTAPSEEVVRKMLPHGKPCLILMDELMNYMSRYRARKYSDQLYSFLQILSEVARSQDGMVLVVSIPASELEMTSDDHADYTRLKKLLDRLSKPVIMSVGSETSEIIRRRLFEWDGIPADGRKAISDYVHWVIEHRQQMPSDIQIDQAKALFEASYPFHPAVLSVFERKWQTLPRFQQTRGMLRLLALWIANNYQKGYTGARKDPLIELGSAPLDDSLFRTAAIEQLGENKLEAVVTTDIAGKKDSRAISLDEGTSDTTRKARLHQKVATSIFFESNGGQIQAYATLPEIRFAVGGPDIDLATIEVTLDALAPPNGACFYLDASPNRYWFSPKANLTKIHADRMASISEAKLLQISERMKAEVQRVFQTKAAIRPEFFPERSNQIPDRAEVSLIVMSPDKSPDDKKVCESVRTLLKEYGQSARVFKNAVIFSMTDEESRLLETAKKIIAWEEILDDADALGLDKSQKQQIEGNIKTTGIDLKEAVWRSYRYIVLLGKNNELQLIDLGLINSGSSSSLTSLILERLSRDDLITANIGPKFLVRKWPPALVRWTTRSVRDAFFASPEFPRLLNPEILKETLAKGVANGDFGYGSEQSSGVINPFYYKETVSSSDIEISDEVFIIPSTEAEKLQKPRILTTIDITPAPYSIKPGESIAFSAIGRDQYGEILPLDSCVWETDGGSIDSYGEFLAGKKDGTFEVKVTCHEITQAVPIRISEMIVPLPRKKVEWSGDIQPQKWMNFYMKVLGKFATRKGLKISVKFEVRDKEGISEQIVEEARTALRELGLSDQITLKNDVEYKEE